ncbi:hypothetical protein P8452_58375 [Trifolium repens]|jgi:hypothetical protein|nr:hypothetical protein P8452_58375 [Trifolium repens]
MMQSDELPLPVYDLSKFLRYKPGGPTDWVTHCDAIAKSLEKLGVVLVKDRRLTRPYLQALHSAETLLADNLEVTPSSYVLHELMMMMIK